MRAAGAAAFAVAVASMLDIGAGGAAAAPSRDPLAHAQIKHVVVIMQENHYFNDILGRFCVDHGDRCIAVLRHSSEQFERSHRVEVTSLHDDAPAR